MGSAPIVQRWKYSYMGVFSPLAERILRQTEGNGFIAGSADRSSMN
jgi:hypothetical protein